MALIASERGNVDGGSGCSGIVTSAVAFGWIVVLLPPELEVAVKLLLGRCQGLVSWRLCLVSGSLRAGSEES